jgi:uncharacterized membrane protein HdeD (DUF308 family)
MEEIKQAVSSTGTTMKIFGVIVMILGILAILAPLATGMSVIYVLGFLVLAGGIVRLFAVFSPENKGQRFGKLIGSILVIICGLVLIGNPLVTTGLITILIAIFLIVDGIFEIADGTGAKPAEGWGWLVFGGIASIILGIMIFTHFPLSGAWALGLFLGIKLFLVGLIMLKGGSALRRVAKA